MLINILIRYYNRPDKTAEAFHVDSEGVLWFRSGDIARIDQEGFVYILDRAKDLIIRGGVYTCGLCQRQSA